MLSYEYYELFCEYKYQMPSVDQIVQRWCNNLESTHSNNTYLVCDLLVHCWIFCKTKFWKTKKKIFVQLSQFLRKISLLVA